LLIESDLTAGGRRPAGATEAPVTVSANGGKVELRIGRNREPDGAVRIILMNWFRKWGQRLERRALTGRAAVIAFLVSGLIGLMFEFAPTLMGALGGLAIISWWC
jgi:hypothetical protein